MDEPAAAPREGGGTFVPAEDAASAAVDARGVVTAWSPGARRLLGHPAEDVIGRPAVGLLAEDVTATARRCLAEGSGWHGELRLRHRDGSMPRTTVRAFPALDGRGGRQWLLTATPREAPPETPREAPPESLREAPYESSRETHRQDDPLTAENPRETDAHLVEWAFTHSPLILAIYDLDGRILRMNAATRRLLHLDEDQVIGRRVDELYRQAVHDNEPAAPAFSDPVVAGLRRVGDTGVPIRYEVSAPTSDDPRETAWSVSISPVRDPDGRVRGVFTAGSDITEQYLARQRLAMLNEAGYRIGTTLDVSRTAQELADMAVPRLADFVSVDLLAAVLQGDEPPVAPVVLRRVAHQSNAPGAPEAVVALGEVDSYPDYAPPVRCMDSGEAMLVGLDDPGVARWLREDPVRSRRQRAHGFHSVIAAPLRARGTTLGVAVFLRSRPDAFQRDDLLLAEELAARAAVCVDNARRYTHERTTALALQRSLLPRRLSVETAIQATVEAASRYVPTSTEAGIGGDWFDVIPLSGTRVALVVGDVVGHGIRASATMGRLRAAVRTLADVDLPPDELLTHLDDLVVHLSERDDALAPVGESAGETGATCLYAVYDPVSRRCVLASAGHPPPAVVAPDGSAGFVRMSVGPPLGLGGLPFEATEVELAEHSLIALFTDGLVASRDRDIDAGLGMLSAVLARPAPSLEETCDRVLRALLPDRPTDDAALLVARTRVLDAQHVATWDVAADPAMVAHARKAASDRLAAWGLEEAAFVIELVVSELVTNAIRYASAPIELRLIRGQTSLICEVSDASGTAPHMRRARAFDEGGRGLLLVAQLTQRWGTRQTATGKIIWAEKDLSAQ